jgi:hypothetical protein
MSMFFGATFGCRHELAKATHFFPNRARLHKASGYLCNVQPAFLCVNASSKADFLSLIRTARLQPLLAR